MVNFVITNFTSIKSHLNIKSSIIIRKHYKNYFNHVLLGPQIFRAKLEMLKETLWNTSENQLISKEPSLHFSLCAHTFL